jgi:hypothetical protein
LKLEKIVPLPRAIHLHVFSNKRKKAQDKTLNEKKINIRGFCRLKFESKSENKIKCNKTCIMLYVNLSKNKPFRSIF